MRVDLAFGKTGLSVDLPSGFQYRLLEARSASAVADSLAAIETALDSPIGSPPLEQLARGKRSAAISVCDITRPAPNRLTLPPMLARLERAGVPRSEITILIATGLHREATLAEILEIVGPDIAGSYRIVNHCARVREEQRLIGNTRGGTPVWIDERFCAADLHLTLGFIEPHLMLGFSGGRKLVAPGLAGADTIKVLHSPKFMRDPRTHEGSIDDNPLHRELLEIASMARHDFLCDVALTRKREIAGVFAGDPVAAHARGVEFVRHAMLEQLDRPADAVITTSAGYPLDLTYYQAIKGITAAQHVLKPGGRILLAAACDEGAGAPEFVRMVDGHGTHDSFFRHIDANPVEVDQWQLEKLGLVTQQHEVLFYCPGVAGKRLWGPNHGSIDEAVAALTRGLPPGATIAVIPEGPYVLAKAEEAVMA